MPCYRCGVRQTDPSRGQSPWKRGVRRQSQILICPGCQDTVDWVSEMDRCSRCSSVHLVKRLGEVECRDCGAIVTPEGSGDAGLADAGLGDAGLANAGSAEAGSGEEPDGAGPAVAGRGPDLSEEVARALDRVLSRSLVSQSLVSQSVQRASGPEGRPGAGSGGGSGAGSGSGSGAGRHRPARTPADHAAAHPGAFAG
jgi:hypothetical protein